MAVCHFSQVPRRRFKIDAVVSGAILSASCSLKAFWKRKSEDFRQIFGLRSSSQRGAIARATEMSLRGCATSRDHVHQRCRVAPDVDPGFPDIYCISYLPCSTVQQRPRILQALARMGILRDMPSLSVSSIEPFEIRWAQRSATIASHMIDHGNISVRISVMSDLRREAKDASNFVLVLRRMLAADARGGNCRSTCVQRPHCGGVVTRKLPTQIRV